MYSKLYLPYSLLVVLLQLPLTVVHAFVMVRTIDDSFVPLLFPRAPGEAPVPVSLLNNNDLSYLATVTMGTPQQQIQMAPSLAQNLIAVASPPSGVADASYYSPALSSSSTPSNEIASIQTVAGSSFTGQFTGELCALQSSTTSYTYNASVAVTDSSVTDALYPDGARGVLGYGVGALAPSAPGGASLLGSFLAPNFTSAVCGIELNHMSDPVPNGVFTMGAIDSSAFTGDFVNVGVPADSPASWSIPFDTLTYSASGTPTDLPGMLASVDIFHSVIQIPTPHAKKVYDNIPGSYPVSDTKWSIPCNASFPISLSFKNKKFTISERDTIKKENGACYGNIVGGANNIGKLGAPFLRNVYTHFGVNKSSDGSAFIFVGFAEKKLRQK